jgi:hypothetical protein
MNRILLNRIQTPDGTILTSRHRHEYLTHKDANGETYMVDGGKDYLRRNANVEPFVELSVVDEGSHEERRKYLTWGSYGLNGDEPLKITPVCDMDTDHLLAIKQNVGFDKIDSLLAETMAEELRLRTELSS